MTLSYKQALCLLAEPDYINLDALTFVLIVLRDNCIDEKAHQFLVKIVNEILKEIE